MTKILVVDDSDTFRMEIRDILEAGHFDVVEANDGKDGVEKFKSKGPFDLIITDLNMPELDGVSMCKKIREDASAMSVPIFMLTTESSTELKVSGKEAGVMLWIVKSSFSGEKLLGAITKVLSMKKAA